MELILLKNTLVFDGTNNRGHLATGAEGALLAKGALVVTELTFVLIILLIKLSFVSVILAKSNLCQWRFLLTENLVNGEHTENLSTELLLVTELIFAMELILNGVYLECSEIRLPFLFGSFCLFDFFFAGAA